MRGKCGSLGTSRVKTALPKCESRCSLLEDHKQRKTHKSNQPESSESGTSCTRKHANNPISVPNIYRIILPKRTLLRGGSPYLHTGAHFVTRTLCICSTVEGSLILMSAAASAGNKLSPTVGLCALKGAKGGKKRSHPYNVNPLDERSWPNMTLHVIQDTLPRRIPLNLYLIAADLSSQNWRKKSFILPPGFHWYICFRRNWKPSATDPNIEKRIKHWKGVRMCGGPGLVDKEEKKSSSETENFWQMKCIKSFTHCRATEDRLPGANVAIRLNGSYCAESLSLSCGINLPKDFKECIRTAIMVRTMKPVCNQCSVLIKSNRNW